MQTIPGKSSYYCFTPDGDSLKMKNISNERINNVRKFNDPKVPKQTTSYQTGKYIAYYYDKVW